MSMLETIHRTLSSFSLSSLADRKFRPALESLDLRDVPTVITPTPPPVSPPPPPAPPPTPCVHECTPPTFDCHYNYSCTPTPCDSGHTYTGCDSGRTSTGCDSTPTPCYPTLSTCHVSTPSWGGCGGGWVASFCL